MDKFITLTTLTYFNSGHGDVLDELSPLPQELLNTLLKPVGQLVYFGGVNWDACGKREMKGVKVIPNLNAPHKFGDWKVGYIS